VSIFKNEDTLKTGFQFQQEQKTQGTSGFGLFLGVAIVLFGLGAVGLIEVDNGGNNNNRRQQPAAESSLPLQTSRL
jgi:hypothetical protein